MYESTNRPLKLASASAAGAEGKTNKFCIRIAQQQPDVESAAQMTHTTIKEAPRCTVNTS